MEADPRIPGSPDPPIPRALAVFPFRRGASGCEQFQARRITGSRSRDRSIDPHRRLEIVRPERERERERKRKRKRGKRERKKERKKRKREAAYPFSQSGRVDRSRRRKKCPLSPRASLADHSWDVISGRDAHRRKIPPRGGPRVLLCGEFFLHGRALPLRAPAFSPHQRSSPDQRSHPLDRLFHVRRAYA